MMLELISFHLLNFFFVHLEIATCTRGKSHVKIQCTTTGVTTCVIRTEANKNFKIDNILVCIYFHF